MKLFLRYLIGHKRTIIVALVCVAVFFASFMLYHLPMEAVLYPTVLCVLFVAVVCSLDFFRVKRKHEALERIKTMTDTMTETFPVTDSIEDEDYSELVRCLSAEYNEYKGEMSRKYSDMMEYYTMWVHQIKTPIASMHLNLQNEDSASSRKLSSDLNRIERYAEMVLTYLRLDSESTDYVFRECDLDKIVKSAVKKFSSEFISRKIRLVYEPLNTTVVTDEKWLSFVVEQVLSNALKYTPSGSISVSLVGEKTLRISDTGIGIAAEDLPRIFENGYTGYNGRRDGKASGIGLYLCKRTCTNLGHKITASSCVDKGTTIDIDLSQAKSEFE